MNRNNYPNPIDNPKVLSLLNKIIQKVLKPPQREIILLALEGKTNEEIRSILGIPDKVLRQKKSRAKSKLMKFCEKTQVKILIEDLIH